MTEQRRPTIDHSAARKRREAEERAGKIKNHKPRATAAQARRIAGLFSYAIKLEIPVDDDPFYIDATDTALIKHGFVERTGATGMWPSGKIYEHLTLTEAGLDALADYLIHRNDKK